MTEAGNLIPRLEELARRAVEPEGLEVAWIEFKSEGSSSLFRVFIDRDTGVGLEDCERVSERLGVILDVEDPIESRYTLEVSTPGLDRPLWRKKDYERFVGRLARVKTKERVGDRNHFRGRLAGVDGDDVFLESSTDRWRIPLALIESGRLEVEVFQPREAAGGRKRNASNRAKRRS
jgi:ribosome maturation factor RimP